VVDKKEDQSIAHEFDEKTAAAIKHSLETNTALLEGIESGVQSQKVDLVDIRSGMQSQGLRLDDIGSQVLRLEDIGNGMQSQVVKLNDIGSQVVKLEGIENGVCNVIPDYQNEILRLKDALSKKTAACDTIEGKLAYKTRVINQQDVFVAKLVEEQTLYKKEKQALQDEVTALKEQLDVGKYITQLKQMLDTTQIISSALTEERVAKRHCV
jgi:uncharacterized protein YhaN